MVTDCLPLLTKGRVATAQGWEAFYYDNREEIDAELAADEAWAESLR
jgi:hypothetical protein